MTFGETRTKFLSRLNRRDCTNSLADGFLQDSIKRVQRLLAAPTGEKSVEITVADDTYTTDGRMAIPSDFLRLKDITVNNLTVLVRKPLSQVLYEVEYGAEGASKFYARQGGAWVFAPAPIAGDVVRVDYYAEYDAVEEDADETVLLDIASDLVIFGALSYACDHYNDRRGQRFEDRFVQILSDIQAQADNDELTGNATVGQAFQYPADHCE
jgi:hypothetical protein